MRQFFNLEDFDDAYIEFAKYKREKLNRSVEDRKLCVFLSESQHEILFSVLRLTRSLLSEKVSSKMVEAGRNVKPRFNGSVSVDEVFVEMLRAVVKEKFI